MYCESVSASRSVKLRAACANTSSAVSIAFRFFCGRSLSFNSSPQPAGNRTTTGVCPVSIASRSHRSDAIDIFFFCGRRPLPFGGSHLRLPSGPAGIRTTTLSALARPTPTEPSGRLKQLTMKRRANFSCTDVREIVSLAHSHIVWGST